MTETEKAIQLYDIYTEAVGGKAWDGRPLPTGAEFFADESKTTQQHGWLAVARAANRNMSFGAALEAMRDGKAVRLPHWKEDVHIRMQAPDAHSKMTAPYLYVTSRFGCVPWVVTQIELLSTEWEIHEAK